MEFDWKYAKNLLESDKGDYFIKQLDYYLSREEDEELKKETLEALEALVIKQNKRLQNVVMSMPSIVFIQRRMHKLFIKDGMILRPLTEEERENTGLNEIERVFKLDESEELKELIGEYLINAEIMVDDEMFLATVKALFDIEVEVKLNMVKLMEKSDLYNEVVY
ncbi:hypothetical protein D3C71_1313090 [compost metagenome]